MYPLIASAKGAPSVKLRPYTAIGPLDSFRIHKSLTVSPVLVNGAPPAKSPTNPQMGMVPMFGLERLEARI